MTKSNARNCGVKSKKDTQLASIAQCRKIKLVQHELDIVSNRNQQQRNQTSLDVALVSFIAKLPKATGENLERILSSINGILKSKSVTFPMKDIITNLGELLNRNLKKKYQESVFNILKILSEKYTQSVENYFGELSLFIKFSLQQPSDNVQKFGLSVLIMVLERINLQNITVPFSLINGLVSIFINNSEKWQGTLSEFRMKLMKIDKNISAQQWTQIVLVPLITILDTLVQTFFQNENSLSNLNSFKELDIIKFADLAPKDDENVNNSKLKASYDSFDISDKFVKVILDLMAALVPSKSKLSNETLTKPQQGSKIYPEVANLLFMFLQLLKTVLNLSNFQESKNTHLEAQIFTFVLKFFEQNFPFFIPEKSFSENSDLLDQFKPFVMLNLTVVQFLIDFKDKYDVNSKNKALIYSYILKIIKLKLVDQIFISTLEISIFTQIFPPKAIETICNELIEAFLSFKLDDDLSNRLLKIICSHKDNIEISKCICSKDVQRQQIEKLLIIQRFCNDQQSQRQWFYGMMNEKRFEFDENLFQIFTLNPPKSQQDFLCLLTMIDNTSKIIEFEKLFLFISNISKLVPSENLLTFKLFAYLILFEPLLSNTQVSYVNRVTLQIATCYYIHLKSLNLQFIPEILSYLPESSEKLSLESINAAKLCGRMMQDKNNQLSVILNSVSDLQTAEIDKFYSKNAKLRQIFESIKVND